MIQQNIELANISTFGIGGQARYFVEVHSIEEMRVAVLESKNLKTPYLVIGKGSNSLFDSRGFNGLVIHNKINFLHRLNENSFHVGSGYSFSYLGTLSAKLQLSGLEFASGIPGSVGGAVFMNAGANGMETCETLNSVEFLEDNGTITNYLRKDLNFSYRTSPFQQKKGVILSATFVLTPLNSAREKQIAIIDYRKKTQPLKSKSAGCIFQNPKECSAGALIEKCGLKGLKIGDAEVSDIHANFIVNKEKATSDDVLNLIDLIKIKVKETSGQDLHSEVRYIPYNLERVNERF